MPRDFYGIVAQVLPVVLLALLWESRFLENLRRQSRQPRRDDPEHGVRFWTHLRVRIYSLFVSTLIVLDIATCVFVLGNVLPDSKILRGLVLGGLVLALLTLLTRIWIDVIAATAPHSGGDAPCMRIEGPKTTGTSSEAIPPFVELESGGPPPVACRAVGLGQPPSRPTNEGHSREHTDQKNRHRAERNLLTG